MNLKGQRLLFFFVFYISIFTLTDFVITIKDIEDTIKRTMGTISEINSSR